MRNTMTTGTLAEIERLNKEGKHDTEIGEILGIRGQQVRRWRIRLGLPKVDAYFRGPRKEYAVYDGKTEVLVALGTAEECARALDTSVNVFYSLKSKAKNGNYKKYSFCEVEP